jgi:hypothetical protein
MSCSFPIGLLFFDRSQDGLDRDTAGGHQLAPGAAGRRGERRRPRVLPDQHARAELAAPSWPTCGSPTSTWTWTFFWCSARVAASGPFRSGTGPARPSTANVRVRARHKHAHLPWLWLGLKGRLPSHGLVILLRRRGRQAGLPGLHPYQFRHTFAHPWLAEGGGETDLMRLAGWKSRAILQRYGASGGRRPHPRGPSASLPWRPAVGSPHHCREFGRLGQEARPGRLVRGHRLPDDASGRGAHRL